MGKPHHQQLAPTKYLLKWDDESKRFLNASFDSFMDTTNLWIRPSEIAKFDALFDAIKSRHPNHSVFLGLFLQGVYDEYKHGLTLEEALVKAAEEQNEYEDPTGIVYVTRNFIVDGDPRYIATEEVNKCTCCVLLTKVTAGSSLADQTVIASKLMEAFSEVRTPQQEPVSLAEKKFVLDCNAILRHCKEDANSSLKRIMLDVKETLIRARKSGVSRTMLNELRCTIEETQSMLSDYKDELSVTMSEMSSPELSRSNFNLSWLSEVERLLHISQLAQVSRKDAFKELLQFVVDFHDHRFSEYQAYVEFTAAMRSALKSCNARLLFKERDCSISSNQGTRGQGSFRLTSGSDALITSPNFPKCWIVERG